MTLYNRQVERLCMGASSWGPLRRGIGGKLAVTICVLILAGCASYKEGGSRTVGEFTDDVGIQAAVKTALIRDKEISGLRINVEVSRSVVSLYGRIPSDYARQKALKIAAGVRGVASVQDRLTLVVE